jgi:hypothetical protein
MSVLVLVLTAAVAGLAATVFARLRARRAVEERVEALCGQAEAALRKASFFEDGASLLQQLARKFASRDH